MRATLKQEVLVTMSPSEARKLIEDVRKIEEVFKKWFHNKEEAKDFQNNQITQFCNTLKGVLV